ncbi:PREDICTED: uncharacterized protein LOC108493989 isoform X1 [Lepidothrix coronata]|uniref:Uncharacterized protein LOC108493989 isoform X1 n=1 Tax=Lepidothrix coronata TaxID=321398 RepID=A0A6J0GNQ2_9PASS|nr:PREDICTED: uncharacterized protein LOC108493989 isoform X1 [Lepidothrix coronata]
MEGWSGWKEMIFRVPSKPSHPTIPSFCGPHHPHWSGPGPSVTSQLPEPVFQQELRVPGDEHSTATRLLPVLPLAVPVRPCQLPLLRPPVLNSTCCLELGIHSCRMGTIIPKKVHCHSMELAPTPARVRWRTVGMVWDRDPSLRLCHLMQVERDTEEEMEVDMVVAIEEMMEVDLEDVVEEMEIDLEEDLEEMDVDQHDEEEEMILG